MSSHLKQHTHTVTTLGWSTPAAPGTFVLRDMPPVGSDTNQRVGRTISLSYLDIDCYYNHLPIQPNFSPLPARIVRILVLYVYRSPVNRLFLRSPPPPPGFIPRDYGLDPINMDLEDSVRVLFDRSSVVNRVRSPQIGVCLPLRFRVPLWGLPSTFSSSTGQPLTGNIVVGFFTDRPDQSIRPIVGTLTVHYKDS